jgi:hypothetical protein
LKRLSPPEPTIDDDDDDDELDDDEVDDDELTLFAPNENEESVSNSDVSFEITRLENDERIFDVSPTEDC